MQTQRLSFKHRDLGSLIDFGEVIAGSAADSIALIDAATADRTPIVDRKFVSRYFGDMSTNFIPHGIKLFFTIENSRKVDLQIIPQIEIKYIV